MSTMLDPLNEADSGMYLKKSGIDRSVGYLIAGVVVLLSFLLSVVGMARIQKMNDGIPTTNRNVPEEKPPEIGDAEVAGAQN